MSMVGLALRLSAVMALKNATLAGKRVFDSAILPVDKLTTKAGPEPFIAISTEDETSKPSGRDLHNGDRTIDLVIEVAIGKTVALPGDGGTGVQVADTDANLEMSLAIVMRQVEACLFGAGGGQWGKVFRAIAKAIEETVTRRGLPEKEGERFAARQTGYRIKAFAEPAFGQQPAPGSPFALFLAALDAEPGYEAFGAIVRQAIEGVPIGWPEVYTVGAIMAGYTEEEAQSIGIAPLGGADSAPLAELTILPDGMVLDADSIEASLPPDEGET
ncbi:MAG: hypothetical protein BGO05_05440 [Rhizobiales bacterium 63-7]|nr:hypothetical protein [Hyphomicrobiales bacterium]OJU66646.1 MAG: hypothetical protein BGO05_05440 [Rhizobiales bacterium 63-7]